ncbi:ATPase [Camelimonas fluminis]|uniref:histidine kinase n=1 Tax=Camelimonas fluminis TaxID=1576911 RepID=A0ABV7UIT6_9HYPH|nr:ATP-binding protein [Camelimonas fluminis]GHE67931.1 ATPase [Camelimonas fluminis]
MTDPAGHITLTDLLARPADAPVVEANDVACLFAADGALLWATAPGRALAARLDRPSRARVLAFAAEAPGALRAATPVRAGGVGFSARISVLQRHDGAHAVMVQVAGRIPRAWGAAPERFEVPGVAGDSDAPANALRTMAGARPTLRFVWHTDAMGVIRSVSAALVRALGGETIIGKTWAGLAHEIVAAPELDAQVRSGRAWSGLATTWRLDALGADIPVEFGGAPIRDASGAPAGQRGYGLMRLDEAATVAPPSAVDIAPVDVAPADITLVDAPEPQGDVFGAEPQYPEQPPQQLAAKPPEPGPAQEGGDGLSSIVARVASGSPAPEPALPLFTPLADARPAAPRPVPPARHADIRRKSDASGLSHGERQTLRDIARALGARVSDDEARRQEAAVQEAAVQEAAHEGGDEAPVPPAEAPLAASRSTASQSTAGRSTGRQSTKSTDSRGAAATGSGAASAIDTAAPPGNPVPLAQPAAVAGTAGGDARATSDGPPESEPAMELAGQEYAPKADLAPKAAGPGGPADPAPAQELTQDLARDLAQELERQLGKERAAIASDAQVEALRALVQAMPVAALVSQEGVAAHANNAFLALSRHAGFGDVAGQRLGLLFPETALSACFSGKGVLAGARGVRTPVELICAPVPWTGGEALLILALRDATAEVAARSAHLEDELAASAAREAELRGVLDTATDGVVLLDAHGRILSVNRSAEALFGYEQNQLVGESLTRLLAPESHAAAQDYLDSLRAGGVASLLNDGREVIGRVRQGGDCRLFMTLGKVGGGGNPRYCAVLRDVTAWKKTESELIESKRRAEAANAQKSDFLARMSHEVRTPLGAMIGFAELMLEERFGPIQNPRYREYVRDIHESGQYVISLVNDLLDLARIEAGKMELSFASVDLNAVLNSCVTLMQPQANKAHIVLRSSLEAKLPPVVADERSMRQITLNVLGNALKFTDAGGQVILSSTRTPAGEVVIRVRDTGIGMSEQEVVEALKPFRRLAHGRKTPGTGLGLPLTAALVEANRGALRISSTPGEGTLVDIVLPPSRVLAG